jgi:hypothetical protein
LKGDGNDLYLWKAIESVKKLSLQQRNNQTFAVSFLSKGHGKENQDSKDIK